MERKMVAISPRRRNILLACGAVAAGGYVTYRVYHSRKWLRMFLFFESFSTLLEVLAAGSDSFSVVLSDLHRFLVSEEDEVPQSLKQLLRLARSPEAQESIAAVTAAVSRGLLLALTSGGPVAPSLEERPRRQQSFRSALSSSNGAGNFVETKKVIKLGNKDVHGLEGGVDVASTSLDDRALSPDNDDNVEESLKECDGLLDVDAWSNAGSVLDGVKAQVDSSIARGMKEALQEGLGVDYNSGGNEAEVQSEKQNGKGELVDRLVEKLFSESGKGFASAMVASASQSFVTSIIEYMNTPNSSRDMRSESEGGLIKGMVSLARSVDGKAVLTNWIQTFVGTAVSVYLDQTKDINAFDELAASLEKPEHRSAITDLLSTVCEASTSSFVRTSHEVLTSDPSSSKEDSISKAIVPSSEGGELFHDTEGSEVFYNMGEQEPISPRYSPVKWKGRTVVGKSDPAPTNYIEQISNVLAVPSNRKLILDIARTMTSSAVRSTIDVSLGKVSAALGVKGKEPASKELF